VTSRPVLVAFVVFVLFAGSNAAAVKTVLGELAPLWSAALRFLIAGALLLALMLAQHRPVPRGDHLRGTLIYGVIAFAIVYFFLYLAIGDTGSGTTMTVLSVVPLLTVLLSAVHGIERPRLLGVVGALVAAAGIVIVAADQLTLNVPLTAIGLLLAGAFFQAEQVVVVKRLPPGDPVAANAIGMLLGGTLLIVAGLATGEPIAGMRRPLRSAIDGILTMSPDWRRTGGPAIARRRRNRSADAYARRLRRQPRRPSARRQASSSSSG